MKIGLAGYQGSGKSTLFEWLTNVAPDHSLTHTGQSAMATIPEPRIDSLCEVYHPKKVTRASIEVVDTPGLSRTHEGNAARLALIREAGCLVLVVAAFDGSDPAAELSRFEEDLMLADMDLITRRLERIEESMKKSLPRAEKEALVHEDETLRLALERMEAGDPLREDEMSEEQRKVTRAFRLLSEKPRMVVVNTADDEDDPIRYSQCAPEKVPIFPVPIGLELELARMSPEERAEFEEEMGVGGTDKDQLIRTMLQASGQMLFFTAGEKEVRTWLLPKGGTAVEAAGGIHTDLARGFIRAEIMTCSDLVRLGSEREVKANHLVRQEPKDYVVQDDDILLIRFSV